MNHDVNLTAANLTFLYTADCGRKNIQSIYYPQGYCYVRRSRRSLESLQRANDSLLLCYEKPLQWIGSALHAIVLRVHSDLSILSVSIMPILLPSVSNLTPVKLGPHRAPLGTPVRGRNGTGLANYIHRPTGHCCVARHDRGLPFTSTWAPITAKRLSHATTRSVFVYPRVEGWLIRKPLRINQH